MAALSPFDARARVLAACQDALPAEVVPLGSAHGRFLAEPVHASGPWPATDRSAMDGFALGAVADAVEIASGTCFPVVGESLAGRPFARELGRGEAIRIMTGAVVPTGAYAVVPVEQTSGFAGDRMTVSAPVRAGQNVRRMASEIAAGQCVLAAGERLGAAAIGVLAVLGHTEVRVARRPRVAIVATGDEVVPVHETPLPHQVRESNSWALAAQVRECGGEALRIGIAPDEAGALRAMLACGLEIADVLITIGGISKGSHDLVHGTLGELGVHTEFHGLDLKPGKPTYFGRREVERGARFVVGLPGNPASSFTVFDLLVRPLLTRLSGGDPGEWVGAAVARGAPWSSNARLQAVPARFHADGSGSFIAELAAPSPSGDPFGLLRADGYALVPGNARPADTTNVRIAGSSRGVVLP